MDIAARQSERPIGQEVTTGPNDDDPEGSADRAPQAEGAPTRPGASGEHDEALSLLQEAEAMLKVAQHRTAKSREPLGQDRGEIERGPLWEARGMALGAVHRMVDAIAILENEQRGRPAPQMRAEAP
jgi:hypothetical protein